MVEAEKRTNRASIDSEVFVLPQSSFVLELDYGKIAKRLRLNVTTSFVSLKMHAISLLRFRLLWLTRAELLVDVFNRLHQAAVNIV